MCCCTDWAIIFTSDHKLYCRNVTHWWKQSPRNVTVMQTSWSQIMIRVLTRWTCTPSLRSPATWCSRDWTATLQRSWPWTVLRLRGQSSTRPRERRSTRLLFSRTDSTLIRVCFLLFLCLSTSSLSNYTYDHKLLFFSLRVTLLFWSIVTPLDTVTVTLLPCQPNRSRRGTAAGQDPLRSGRPVPPAGNWGH